MFHAKSGYYRCFKAKAEDTHRLGPRVKSDMDISDVAVRHLVAIPPLNIQHSFDISSSTVSIARELRFCVIAIVVGLTTASIVKSVLVYKRPDTSA